MAKELTTTTEQLPAFLTQEEKLGTEGLKQYQRPSFAKVVQAMTKEPIKPPYVDGDLVILPELQKIVSEGEICHAVPIFFYPEFCVHNPLGSEEFIRERSLDETSEIAKRARSRNQQDRQFTTPDGKDCQYVEHLNFMVVFLDHNEAIGKKPVVLSFFKGEWKHGATFASLIDARNAPIMGCRFQLTTGTHRNNQYSWKGIDVSNPDDGGKWVTDENLFEQLKKMHVDIKEVFDSGQVSVDYETEKKDETEF